MDKLDKSYIWHQVMLAKMKLRIKEIGKCLEKQKN